jgi:hypothetical protein
MRIEPAIDAYAHIVTQFSAADAEHGSPCVLSASGHHSIIDANESKERTMACSSDDRRFDLRFTP